MDYCRRPIAGQLLCPSDGSSCRGGKSNRVDAAIEATPSIDPVPITSGSDVTG